MTNFENPHTSSSAKMNNEYFWILFDTLVLDWCPESLSLWCKYKKKFPILFRSKIDIKNILTFVDVRFVLGFSVFNLKELRSEI